MSLQYNCHTGRCGHCNTPRDAICPVPLPEGLKFREPYPHRYSALQVFVKGTRYQWLLCCSFNIGLHHFVAMHSPHTGMLSYVDNWEALHSDATEVLESFDRIQQFADIMDLRLDLPKTYFWSTSSDDRTLLRNDGRITSYGARDLGGQMQYCCRPTNKVIKTRIADHVAFWGWLSRSHSPLQLKLRAILTVAWPRCLFGIATTGLGKEVLNTLRSQAMKSLRWDKRGASSKIQFGAILHPVHDPEFFAGNLPTQPSLSHCLIS